MTQADLIKLHALLSKLQFAASDAAQTDSSFEKDYADSLQTLKDFSDRLNHFEEGLKSAKAIPHTFREAN